MPAHTLMDVKDAIAAECVTSTSARAIARQYGVTPQTVAKVVEDRGIERPPISPSPPKPGSAVRTGPWSDERIENLRAALKEGLSATQIAKRLGAGISRNAVIGKVLRMGLSLPGSASREPTLRPLKAPPVKRDPYCQNGYNTGKANPESRLRALKAPKVARAPSSGSRPPRPGGQGLNFRRADSTPAVEVPKPIAVRDIPAEEAPNAKSILKIGFGECRWPVSGQAFPAMFCAEAVSDGPYCQAHRERAFQRTKPRVHAP